MEETISLGEILSILKKRIVLILSIVVVASGIAGAVTFLLITPQYRSSAQLIVQSKNENGTTNLQADVNANVLLINTYKDMIMGDVVLKPVQEELISQFGLSMSVSDLKDQVTIAQSENSQMFQIQATTENAANAMHIANVVAEVFQEKASDVLGVNKVTITSAATANETPISPNNKLNILIGTMVGMMIGIALAFMLELLDKTVKDERFIAEEMGLPILGTVEELSHKELTLASSLEKDQIVSGKTEASERQKVGTGQISNRRTRKRV